MPSRLLLWSTAAVGAVAVVVPYVRPFTAVFDFVPLAWPLLAIMLVIVMGYIATTEVAKLRFQPPSAVSAHDGAAPAGGRSVADASRMRSVSAAGR